jgi:hypothetical protein
MTARIEADKPIKRVEEQSEDHPKTYLCLTKRQIIYTAVGAFGLLAAAGLGYGLAKSEKQGVPKQGTAAGR